MSITRDSILLSVNQVTVGHADYVTPSEGEQVYVRSNGTYYDAVASGSSFVWRQRQASSSSVPLHVANQAYSAGDLVRDSSGDLFLCLVANSDADLSNNTNWRRESGGNNAGITIKVLSATAQQIVRGDLVIDGSRGAIATDSFSNARAGQYFQNANTYITQPVLSRTGQSDLLIDSITYDATSGSESITFSDGVTNVEVQVGRGTSTSGLTSVTSDATLTGLGTSASPLMVANPFTPTDEAKLDSIALNTTARTITVGTDTLTIPASAGAGISSVMSDATLNGTGITGSLLSVANPFTTDDETKLDNIPSIPTTLGTAGQVLSVNSGRTALEYTNKTSYPNRIEAWVSGTTSYTNTSRVDVDGRVYIKNDAPLSSTPTLTNPNNAATVPSNSAQYTYSTNTVVTTEDRRLSLLTSSNAPNQQIVQDVGNKLAAGAALSTARQLRFSFDRVAPIDSSGISMLLGEAVGATGFIGWWTDNNNYFTAQYTRTSTILSGINEDSNYAYNLTNVQAVGNAPADNTAIRVVRATTREALDGYLPSGATTRPSDATNGWRLWEIDSTDSANTNVTSEQLRNNTALLHLTKAASVTATTGTLTTNAGILRVTSPGVPDLHIDVIYNIPARLLFARFGGDIVLGTEYALPRNSNTPSADDVTAAITAQEFLTIESVVNQGRGEINFRASEAANTRISTNSADWADFPQYGEGWRRYVPGSNADANNVTFTQLQDSYVDTATATTLEKSDIRYTTSGGTLIGQPVQRYGGRSYYISTGADGKAELTAALRNPNVGDRLLFASSIAGVFIPTSGFPLENGRPFAILPRMVDLPSSTIMDFGGRNDSTQIRNIHRSTGFDGTGTSVAVANPSVFRDMLGTRNANDRIVQTWDTGQGIAATLGLNNGTITNSTTTGQLVDQSPTFKLATVSGFRTASTNTNNTVDDWRLVANSASASFRIKDVIGSDAHVTQNSNTAIAGITRTNWTNLGIDVVNSTYADSNTLINNETRLLVAVQGIPIPFGSVMIYNGTNWSFEIGNSGRSLFHDDSFWWPFSYAGLLTNMGYPETSFSNGYNVEVNLI